MKEKIGNEIVEKKKKEGHKKKSSGDDFIGSQDTCGEAKFVEGDVQSTKEDGRDMKEPEGKKKKKPQKTEFYKDDTSDPCKDSLSNGSNDIDKLDTSEMEIIEKKKKKKHKKMSNVDDFIGLQDTCSEANFDDGNVQSTKDEGHAVKERKKKKRKPNKTEFYKDDPSAVWKDSVSNGSNDLGKLDNSEMENVEKKKKKKHKKKSNGDELENVEKKKKKSHKKKSNGDDPQDTCSEAKFDEGDVQLTKDDGHAMKEPERKKKKKPKKTESYKDDSAAASKDSISNRSNGLDKIDNSEMENAKTKKKRKTKNFKNGSDDRQDSEVNNANKGKKRTMPVENCPSDATPNKSNKKVRFSSEDEVFTLPTEEDDLIRGKRFALEEDEKVKEAVYKYIEEHDLGDEGVEMILNCGKHRELKGCWREIGSAIPYRPYIAVYNRARILLMRSETLKWTQEEYDAILKYRKEHGNKWKPLADELGKHTWHVKDTYRRIKLPNLKKGQWSQVEYQKLFDLVNTDLQLKFSEEKKSKHGMLRDNICWSAISDELSTRNQANCCTKWYDQLTSPMVAKGIWADSDDYRLLSALYHLDATCMEDVDWDDIIDNRSGDVCRKRWNQMVMHIGHYGNKSFAEQVEVLAQRYCPNLLEIREIWDGKPRVP